MTVTYCEPFNGSVALNGTIAAWLLPRLMKSPLWGQTVSEQDVYDYIVETCPDHNELFQLAGLPLVHCNS